MLNKKCNRCWNTVIKSTIEWYSYECDYCDESLFNFEVSD